MRILLIDDDSNKIEQIAEYVRSARPDDRLIERRSFQSGLKEVILNPPDLLLLDMTMPTYDVTPKESGGRERRYAGREILRQMTRRRMNVPVVVITQYEQFEEEGRQVNLSELSLILEEQFPQCFVGAVYYQVGNTEWMGEVQRYLDQFGASGDTSSVPVS